MNRQTRKFIWNIPFALIGGYLAINDWEKVFTHFTWESLIFAILLTFTSLRAYSDINDTL